MSGLYYVWGVGLWWDCVRSWLQTDMSVAWFLYCLCISPTILSGWVDVRGFGRGKSWTARQTSCPEYHLPTNPYELSSFWIKASTYNIENSTYSSTWHLSFIMLLCEYTSGPFPVSGAHRWDQEPKCNVGLSILRKLDRGSRFMFISITCSKERIFWIEESLGWTTACKNISVAKTYSDISEFLQHIQ